MKCIVELRSGKVITIDNFLCIEYPKKTEGTNQYKLDNIGDLNLVDGVTYTIIGGNFAKVRGEDILFIHFKS
ncbi:hypothetical protein AST03_05095 [Staphylococcus equorum]|uniref:hypothetical protein n=1 Tax=Staphylococcus TaxID=1279 RepID=UPI000852F779|nr:MULTISPECIES: hypothetical protein [Staphylococcus]MCE4994730.1 hypothetical protein [Staphylococcus xylosus]MCE7784118.1 hypothetical protein [Staphylococcus xylosus]OEK81157.1 hypothetical protein AST03_05095 [Staphylococcus equorum]